MPLDLAFFEAGGREFASVFWCRCTRCGKGEKIGLRMPTYYDANISGHARRLRSACKEDVPLPCRFGHDVKLEELGRTEAMRLHLAFEDDWMEPPPVPFSLAEVPALALASYEVLGHLGAQ